MCVLTSLCLQKQHEVVEQVPEEPEAYPALIHGSDALRSADLRKSKSQLSVPENAVVTMIEPVSSTFYLNLVLVNSKDVVGKMVSERVGKGLLGFGLSARLAATVAKRVVKDQNVTDRLSEKLVDMVPQQIAEMGINLSLTRRYIEGPLLVLKAEILETDPVKLITKAKGPEAGQKMKELQEALTALELGDAKQQMSSKITMQARAKLMEKLAETLPSKLDQAAGAKVELVILSEADEADWFFSFLEAQK